MTESGRTALDPATGTGRMRVALVALTLRLDNVGGLQQRVRTLATGLAARGHSVRIVQGGWAADGSRDFLASVADLDIELESVQPYGRPTRPDQYIRLLTTRSSSEALRDVDIVDSNDPILWPGDGHTPRIYSSISY